MPDGPDGSPVVAAEVAVAPPLLGVDGDEEHEIVTCGRCRLTFARHPTVTPGDSPKWWLCPPCRARLLGDESKTDARWRRSPGRPPGSASAPV